MAKKAKRPTWYEQGFNEGRMGGPPDPPWSKGHRDHTAYMEGFGDGELQAQRDSAATLEGDDDD